MQNYEKWFHHHEKELLSDFFEFLQFPSISTDFAYQEDLLSCQKWIADYVEKLGFDVEIWKEKEGHPVVFGSLESDYKEAPTLLFYQHYDVQPADPLEEWKTPPFAPTIVNDNIYARGALDNKGQCFYVLSAIRAFLKENKKQPLHIKLLIEGEEEIGSPSLHHILSLGRKKKELQADHLFIFDCEMAGENAPAVTVGMRGITSLQIDLQTASHVDLHSGVFGGLTHNPARILSSALAACFDEEGRIVIPSFFQEVQPLPQRETEFLDFDIDFAERGKALGVMIDRSWSQSRLVEANWMAPTLEINGIQSGYTAPGVKTIIPKSATAKLSCRLALGQCPKTVQKLLQDFLRSHVPKEIHCTFTVQEGARAFFTSPRSKTATFAAQACEQAFQTRCRRILTGATIPIAHALEDIANGELVLMGVGLPEDQIHAPNEHISMKRWKRGFLVVSHLLELFANPSIKENE